jgi:hypothetical protein
MAFCHKTRLFGMAMSAGVFVLLQGTPAVATVDGNADARDPDRYEHIIDDMTCVGAEAVKSVSYKVNGDTVVDLIGKVTPDAAVTVEFELAENCGETKLGLASYNAASGALIAQQTGTFDTSTAHTLKVTTSLCAFEVHFFTGDLLQQIGGDESYLAPIPRLVATGNGGTKVCDVAPAAETSTTTSTSTSTTLVGHQRINMNPPVSAAVTEVEDTPISESPVEQVQVAATSIERDSIASAPHLADTGLNTGILALLGCTLLLAGWALTRAAKRHRNEK